MSWMSKLYETYDAIENYERESGNKNLCPIAHFVKKAHVEVVIDAGGKLIPNRIRELTGDEMFTLIPVTEASVGRAGAVIAPHPLSDEISYCAADYPEAKEDKVREYFKQLEAWTKSQWSHPKVDAIHKYLSRKTIWEDLVRELTFPLKEEKKNEKIFLRWRVEEPGNLVSGTWEDQELIERWITYDQSLRMNQKDLCFISGIETRCSTNHPKFIRYPGDGAKLLSSNDSSGYTFRGRFTDKDGLHAYSVGFDTTQKAHFALRWLIKRQGYKNGDQVYVTWAVSGKKIPDPLANSWELLSGDFENQAPVSAPDSDSEIDHSSDIGEYFARQLSKYMNGYHANLNNINDQIVVMGVDSATPGRMAIIFYRELIASDFLERLEKWHREFAWPQRHMKEFPAVDGKKKSQTKVLWFPSTPSIYQIAEVAYGDKLKSNSELKKVTTERLVPCIIDALPFPKDIVESAVRSVSNRVKKRCPPNASNLHAERAVWEKHLGVACALYKGFYQRITENKEGRDYKMALEADRTSRDYLYGRLLAIADYIERIALSVGGEDRPTTADRLMQRFADHPSSTWRNIEIALQPYIQRLKSRRPGFLTNRKNELNLVMSMFNNDDYTDDRPLSGEFLLGYHCQQQAWKNNKENNESEGEES